MAKVGDTLADRFPGDGRAALIREHLSDVCERFIRSGFADPKFESELTHGADDKFWSSLSEALVFRRICGMTLPRRVKVGIGPDFLLEAEGCRVWIEVICPGPSGVPSSWLQLQLNVATSMPHEEILLRWTSAIKEKTDKLVGSLEGEPGYLQKGLVAHGDVYVIAVNGVRLRHGPFPSLTGISQFPFAAEAVFPIGPYQVRIDNESLEVVGSGHQHRIALNKPNGASVPTYAFLDPRSSAVSAVWAVDFNGGSVIGNSEPAAVIHNPNATSPLPFGFLPCEDEYAARHLSEDELLFERIGPKM